MVQGMGVSAGSTTLAALLLRPGLPGAPPEPVAPVPRTPDAAISVAFSAEARQSADRAKNAVVALEADGARWSAAAFGWMLSQRLLALLAADVERAFDPTSPAPVSRSRGGVLDVAV